MKKVIFMLSIFFFFSSYVLAMDTVKFKSCVDGDTFKVIIDDEVYTVRMLAVNTPELAHNKVAEEYYAKEASDYTCNRVKNAKKIELEYDSKSDKTDKYDRILAWVFVDNSLLEKELIEKGYAKVAYLYDNYKYADELKKIQEKVSIKNIGVWDSEAASLWSPPSEESSSTFDDDEASIIEILIVGVLLLIITLVGDKKIKDKKKK